MTAISTAKLSNPWTWDVRLHRASFLCCNFNAHVLLLSKVPSLEVRPDILLATANPGLHPLIWEVGKCAPPVGRRHCRVVLWRVWGIIAVLLIFLVQMGMMTKDYGLGGFWCLHWSEFNDSDKPVASRLHVQYGQRESFCDGAKRWPWSSSTDLGENHTHSWSCRLQKYEESWI